MYGGLLLEGTTNRRFVAAGIVGFVLSSDYSSPSLQVTKKISPCLAVNEPARGSFRCARCEIIGEIIYRYVIAS